MSEAADLAIEIYETAGRERKQALFQNVPKHLQANVKNLIEQQCRMDRAAEITGKGRVCYSGFDYTRKNSR